MIYLNLEDLLKKHNKSKYWLVQSLNSNYTVVNNMIENNTKAIHFDTIDKLCELFECEPNDLFIRKNNI